MSSSPLSSSPALEDESSDGHPIRFVVRETGLTTHTIRAWERRFGAVRPTRSAGGTRRYSDADVARLRALAAAVTNGHRIGDIAHLSKEELALLREERSTGCLEPWIDNTSRSALAEIRSAVAALDCTGLEAVLADELGRLGGVRFAQEVAAPALRDVGQRWVEGQVSIASEHLLSRQLQQLLGNVLSRCNGRSGGPRILVTTPEGDRHEFGALMASIVAASSGAVVVYLGADTPVDTVVSAACQLEARAVLLSCVALPEGSQRRYFRGLRKELDERVPIWVGGHAAVNDPALEYFSDFDDLKARVGTLCDAYVGALAG